MAIAARARVAVLRTRGFEMLKNFRPQRGLIRDGPCAKTFAALEAELAVGDELSLIKPGASCADIHRAHNDFMQKRGLPPELRLYAHGQGYDMVDRPLIRSDETMSIEPNMNLAVHPGYETDSIFAVICDNYIIGAQGPGACLHQTPKQIFEV